MITSQYPDVLEAIKKLQVLKNSAKLVLADALRDISDLKKGIASIVEISNTKPCCDEDLYVMWCDDYDM